MTISVIIATYNAGKTISRALDSVFLYPDCILECIVIDGLSSDKTVEVLKNYKKGHITYISEKDSGVFDALNKGIKMASGDWIYVLGSDDELIPNAIPQFLSYPQIENYDIVYGETIDKYEDGHFRHPHSKNYREVCYRMFACHQAMFMRRKMILDLGGFSTTFKTEADFDLVQRAYKSGYSFLHIPLAIAYFSMSGITGDKKISFDKEQYQILLKNKTCMCPLIIVFFDYIKMLIKRRLLGL